MRSHDGPEPIGVLRATARSIAANGAQTRLVQLELLHDTVDELDGYYEENGRDPVNPAFLGLDGGSRDSAGRAVAQYAGQMYQGRKRVTGRRPFLWLPSPGGGRSEPYLTGESLTMSP